MSEMDERKKGLEELINQGIKFRGLPFSESSEKNLNSWLMSVKKILPRNYLGRVTSVNYFKEIPRRMGPSYLGISTSAIDMVLALLKDEVVKNTVNPNNERELFALRIINARENSKDLEYSISERICGLNPNYPQLSDEDIQYFLTSLGYDTFVSPYNALVNIFEFLMTLDSLQLVDLVHHGLFNKRYYQKPVDIDGKTTFDHRALQIAIEDFNKLLDESSVRTDPIGLSQIFSVSQIYELLFLSEDKTLDDHLHSLLKEAKDLFWVNEIQSANEKLWDAFERLKTILDKDKKRGADQLIDSMVKDIEIIDISNEFTLLTEFGNKYGIRHHETDKIILTTNIEKRYLYFRMLTLIDFAIKSIMGKELTD